MGMAALYEVIVKSVSPKDLSKSNKFETASLILVQLFSTSSIKPRLKLVIRERTSL